MKINRSNRLLLALLATLALPSVSHGQGILTPIAPIVGPTPNGGNILVGPNLLVGGTTIVGGTTADGINSTGIINVATPSPAPVSTGTAPQPTSVIGDAQNTGFIAVAPGFNYSFSTNGSGVQNQVATVNGGVVVNPNGNVTLNETATQTNTANYTIEAREIKVSNPAGFTDTLGTFGPVNAFYANGTTLPGTTTFVATVRDGTGQLVSVISDLAGVGPVTAVDGSGFPILTPAQVAAAVAAGAPASFLTVGAPVVAPNTGDLVVQGNTTLGNTAADTTTVSGALNVAGTANTNGINNNGAQINNLGAGVLATDAANLGQVTAGDAAVTAAFQAADAVVTANYIAADAVVTAAFQAADVTLQNNINAEATTRANADTTLQNNINAEATTRANADVTLQNNINAEAATRASEDTSIRTEFRAADTAERTARIAADNSIRSDFSAADASIRKEFRSADNDLQGNIDKNTRGIAMVAAMTNTTIQPGMKQAIDFNLAQFDDATGFAFGYSYRVNENLQINTAGASTTDFDEAVARLGISYQW